MFPRRLSVTPMRLFHSFGGGTWSHFSWANINFDGWVLHRVGSQLFSPHFYFSHIMWGWKLGERIFLLMPQEENDTSTLPVEGLMVKPCGLEIALVVVELFPPESFSMKFWQSISLQSRKWDPGILLSYLNWFHNFIEISGHCIHDYNQSGGVEAWRRNFAALWSASTWGQADLGGEDCHVPPLKGHWKCWPCQVSKG